MQKYVRDKHPGSAPDIIGYWKDPKDGCYEALMEAGTPLYAVLPNLSFRARLEAFASIAEKLANVHRLQLAHLDVKDDNIVMVELDDNKQYELIDFDNTKSFDCEVTDPTGATAYADPHMRYQSLARPSMDIYALGRSMAANLFGAGIYRPNAKQRSGLVDEGPWKHLDCDEATMSKVMQNNSFNTYDLRKLIGNMLSQSVDERPTADEVKETLNDALAQCRDADDVPAASFGKSWPPSNFKPAKLQPCPWGDFLGNKRSI